MSNTFALVTYLFEGHRIRVCTEEGPGADGFTLALINEAALPHCSRGERRQQIFWDPAVVALLHQIN